MIDTFNLDKTAWARFSPCMKKRYRLARTLTPESAIQVDGDAVIVRLRLNNELAIPLYRGTHKAVCFLMLNPSTATAFVDDPTIRRGISFARSWGADIYEAANIFAWRATDPAELRANPEALALDVDNDRQIIAMCAGAYLVIAAWGTHGALAGRGDRVRQMLADAGVRLHHLKGGTEPQEWR